MIYPMMPRLLALALPLTMITGCANAIDAGPVSTAPAASPWMLYSAPASATESAPAIPPYAVAAGTFLPYRPDSTAITYDPAVVPPGATAKVTFTRTGYGTTVALAVTGLVPDRAYGAHLHTNPCTAIPEDAGPHYQNHKDPASPSTNPAYANPQNEVWLDFTASAAGDASSTAAHGWDFSATAPPRSLVLHAEHTHTAAGEAGKAGARVACLTIPAS